jgi:hypothetical protein
MATQVRHIVRLMAEAVLAAFNQRRLDMLMVRAGKIYHADAAPAAAVSTANATDLTTSIALISALQVSYTTHIASACDATTGQGAHLATDATNVLVAAVPTDLASCETAVNELKAQFNAHLALTSSHPVADATNTVSTADASNLSTTEALANALKTKFNAHIAAAMTAPALAVISP